MKFKNFSLLNAKWALSAFFMASILFFSACDKEEEEESPIASFQFEVNADNFLQVSFTNFSQNADTYAWDFGDGNTSTEENPTHTYAEAGTYDVTLSATGNGETASRAETVNLVDPDQALTLLAGTTSKTWYLQREGIALGVGSAANSNEYWSFGGVTPLGDRPCILDDQYTFHRDGTFEFNSNNTLFIDAAANGGWLDGGVAEACHDESEADILTSVNGDDLSAFGNGGSYTYEFDNTTNDLTLVGLGAYIGLANKTVDGDNFIPQASKSYTIFNFVEGDIADSLGIALVGDASWNFYLVSYHDEANLPAIPTALPTANFSFAKEGNTVTFTNTSVNSDSYSWDFGDGNTSSDENPVHTYAGEGEYTVTLVATDAAGNTSETTQTVTISAATFSAATLSNDSGKIWRLAGEACYIVGSFPGSNEWWAGLDANGVIERACQLDDEFIFANDGVYTVDTKGETWSEDYMLGANSCVADGDIPAPYNVLASGTHAFEVVEATADTPAKITVIGDGAYIGFSKPFNGGELDGTIPPASQITYDVIDYTSSPTTETITLAIDFAGDGTAWWTITIESTN